MRSYVSSRLSGNSSRIRSTLDGKQCRRTSNWQYAHLNLFHVLKFGYKQMTAPLHPTRFLPYYFDNQIPVFISPFLHSPVGANKKGDIICNIFLLSTVVMKRNRVFVQMFE